MNCVNIPNFCEAIDGVVEYTVIEMDDEVIEITSDTDVKEVKENTEKTSDTKDKKAEATPDHTDSDDEAIRVMDCSKVNNNEDFVIEVVNPDPSTQSFYEENIDDDEMDEGIDERQVHDQNTSGANHVQMFARAVPMPET